MQEARSDTLAARLDHEQEAALAQEAGQDGAVVVARDVEKVFGGSGQSAGG